MLELPNGDARCRCDASRRVLFPLPDATSVFPGHGYRGMSCSTMGDEKRLNPRVARRLRGDLIALIGVVEVPPPARIVEAVLANRACGSGA